MINYFENLGRKVYFSVDGRQLEGQIIGIHEGTEVTEETPAWRSTKKTCRYMVDVESEDLGFLWVNYKDITYERTGIS